MLNIKSYRKIKMITSIDHIVLTSKDVDKTINFYCNVLGMKLEKSSTEHEGKLRIFLKFGKQKINVHSEKEPFIPHAKKPISGSVDICFLSDLPLKNWINIFRENHVEIEIGPVKREGAISKINSIYVRDPDMNLVEVSNKI